MRQSFPGCLVADAKNRQYSFYRFYVPDATYFFFVCRVTIQQIGGWFAPIIKDLQSKGVNFQSVSLSSTSEDFGGLFEKYIDIANKIKNAAADDWKNLYRSDDYGFVACYYLDKP
jgi:hypothetical protein